MHKYYHAKKDRTVRFMTPVIWAMLLLPSGVLGIRLWAETNYPGPKPPLWFFVVFALAALVAGYFGRKLAPRGFEVNDSEVVVDRAMSPVRIPLSSVTELRSLGDDELGRPKLLLGASGFYAHYGSFWNSKLGRFRLYSCRLSDLVLVRTENGLYVLGPDSPGEFLSDLRPLIRR